MTVTWALFFILSADPAPSGLPEQHIILTSSVDYTYTSQHECKDAERKLQEDMPHPWLQAVVASFCAVTLKPQEPLTPVGGH